MATKRFLLLICLILGFAAACFAQDENIHGVVRTPTGYLVVWNEPNDNFTLYVKGTHFEQVPNRNLAFLVDGKFLEIVTAATKDILAESGDKKLSQDREILTAHRDWEKAFFEKSSSEKVTVDSEFVTTSNGSLAMFWSFAVPRSMGSHVERQFFLTIRNESSIIVLNGASTKDTDADTVRKFLMDAASTLRTSKKPLSQKDAMELAAKAS